MMKAEPTGMRLDETEAKKKKTEVNTTRKTLNNKRHEAR